MTTARPKIEQIIDDSQAGARLDWIVAERAALTLTAAHELIERGAVWIDRHRVQQPDLLVERGTQLVIHFPPGGVYDTLTITPEDIVWEDRWLLAINKRPGWHANYTPWDVYGTLPYALAAFVSARDEQSVPLHLAHQLDRDTSGVLLVSKDPAINPALQQLFLTGGMHKTYLALATGRIDAQTFEASTGHGRGKSGLFRVYPLADVGLKLPYGSQRVRLMHTRFEVIARADAATLVRALPITGRTHQIRLHLAHLGYPIVGDTRYGGATTIEDLAIPHHLLHAAQLGFCHPVTRAPIELRAPLPPAWTAALARLGVPAP
ncbi:MAG TPA: RluA family pseudouridine synthase [Herpetosiphonaceae bacterium]